MYSKLTKQDLLKILILMIEVTFYPIPIKN